MKKWTDFIKYMLMWVVALFQGLWEVAKGFAKKHPVLVFILLLILVLLSGCDLKERDRRMQELRAAQIERWAFNMGLSVRRWSCTSSWANCDVSTDQGIFPLYCNHGCRLRASD